MIAREKLPIADHTWKIVDQPDPRSVTHGWRTGLREFSWWYKYLPVYSYMNMNDIEQKVLGWFKEYPDAEGITIYVYFVRDEPYIESPAYEEDGSSITFHNDAILSGDSFRKWLRDITSMKRKFFRDLRKREMENKDGVSSGQE